MIVVPEAFAAGTVARCGEPGRRWLERLPGLVEALCADWGLTVDGPPAHGGIGLVVPTRRGPERSALKVSCGDDYPVLRRALRRRGIAPRIARRGVESSERLGRHRRKVERTRSWVLAFRRLTVRSDRYAASGLAFLHLACTLICRRFLRRAEAE